MQLINFSCGTCFFNNTHRVWVKQCWIDTIEIVVFYCVWYKVWIVWVWVVFGAKCGLYGTLKPTT